MKNLGLMLVLTLCVFAAQAQDTIKAEFSVVDVCHGTETAFTNTSKVPAKFGGADYTWKFGDGTTSTAQFASHTYTLTDTTKSQTFTITLIVRSKSIPSEVDSIVGSTRILPNPNPYFTWDVLNKGNTQDVLIDSQATKDGTYFYQWTLASVLKSNDITPSFLHAEVKDYLDGMDYPFTLFVRSDMGCENTYTTSFNYNPLSVTDIVLNRIVAYPNPSNGTIYLEDDFEKIVITDLLGHEVYKASSNERSLHLNLPQGVYVLSASMDNTTFVQRLVFE